MGKEEQPLYVDVRRICDIDTGGHADIEGKQAVTLQRKSIRTNSTLLGEKSR
jgi:hypothetical protein